MEEKKKMLISFNSRKANSVKISIKQKIRNPGVDLCRILGMLDIIIFHFNMVLYNKFSRYSNSIKYLEIITQWHIGNFGMISGIVGYKTCKYSNLLHLWLTVFFYSTTIHYAYKKYNKYLPNYFHTNYIEDKLEYFFPVIFKNYWYFTTYFTMYLFLPLINKGLTLIDKTELTIILISVVGVFFIWRDLILIKPHQFCNDRSITTLLIFFLIGAYIGKYIINGNQTVKKNKNILYYIVWIILFISSSYLTYYSQLYNGNNKFRLILKKLFYSLCYSVGIMIESLSILFIFIQIKYNKYIGKIISFCGPLTFSAYLIHDHMDLRGKLANYFLIQYSPSYSFMHVVSLSTLNGTKVFCICIIIDYFRSLIFRLFRIRQICIFLEKTIFFIVHKIIGEK